MKVLLDTHYLVWIISGAAKLSPAEKALVRESSNTILCSAVSLWELRLKWHSYASSGERKGPIDPVLARTFIDEAGWTLLPLTAKHAVGELDPPIPHKDPFDELLLVQAQVEGLRLLTRDARLRDHPLVFLPA